MKRSLLPALSTKTENHMISVIIAHLELYESELFPISYTRAKGFVSGWNQNRLAIPNTKKTHVVLRTLKDGILITRIK